ncbi:OLC1v1031709C1 [Oldenlandia corymbosa var. corymbosa]|uniref:OLC1v1031709C1 n=1 Tax=Oldenlandia corymbosa var. corymbosa TaxID=529605 RepID=A0AAV1CM06_OLDCO|nr:OLC1v1031709C1 [Oldenlandia corymbosa var. corymbosa]
MTTAQEDHYHRRHHHHHHQPPTFIASSMATAPGIKLHNLSLPNLSWAHKSHNHRHLAADHGRVEKDDVGLGGGGDDKEEERNEVRQWNLRPRRVATLPPPTTSSGVEKFHDSKTVPSRKIIDDAASGSMLMKSSNNNNNNKSSATRVGALGGGSGGGHGSERQRKVVERRKLWISLSKEEIDEDVYALTGSRPRRPKKRPRTVQKLLDNVFPALYLVGMSAESYKGHDPQKRFGDASSNGGATVSNRLPVPHRQPNYTCKKVQEALKHLASIDPLELCNAAKVEYCRATRDLRSCGRYVKSVLKSCGHASLCEECSQRCDVCPICRIPLPKDGDRLHLRLYNECIEACLISRRCDDGLQDKEDGEKELLPDVQRLYSLFDVALENNLSSLICHYVTDVCMDESAVSNDPVVAFLLDEKVVKDWCKRTYKIILTELQEIYKLTVEELKGSLSLLLRFSVKLAGLANVLDVLESSFNGFASAKLNDLYHLQEKILKTKQHMEVVIWCARHNFLEDVRSRHTNIASWRSNFRERKSSAMKRAWPDLVINNATQSSGDNATLFIEEALANIDTEVGHTDDDGEEFPIAVLQQDNGSLFLRSKLEGLAGLYPFESLRAAIDLLFLCGSSDMVVPKQAIFLYYLYDWHWTLPEDKWREIVDDFAATFSITRHSLLESFVFYLLDDHTDEALQEACRLLPEISGPTVHPKVAQVLLERQNPDAALMVLRWSGRDEPRLVSLEEAVTTVRVRVECGLLTEAFMYQRSVCMKVKEHKSRDDSFQQASGETGYACWTWVQWVEALVTEICCLCIRRNLVDRMIELPWNFDEEKHLHKCLLDFAMDDPSSNIGSLLVVFYLQRYRYIEAYEVHDKLISLEQDIVSDEQVSMRMRSISHWRSTLVEKSIELLPDVLQRQLKSGKLPETVVPHSGEGCFPEQSIDAIRKEPPLTSLLLPPVDSSIDNAMDDVMPSPRDLLLNTSSKVAGSIFNHYNDHGNSGASVSRVGLFGEAEKPDGSIRKNFNFDISSTARHSSPSGTSPIRGVNSNISRKDRIMHLQNGSLNKTHNQNVYSHKVAAKPATPSRSNHGLFADFGQDSAMLGSIGSLTTKPDMPQIPFTNDSMDISWSHDDGGVSVEKANSNGGPRWRSDDSSDDDGRQNPVTAATHTRKKRGFRRDRLSRR